MKRIVVAIATALDVALIVAAFAVGAYFLFCRDPAPRSIVRWEAAK